MKSTAVLGAFAVMSALPSSAHVDLRPEAPGAEAEEKLRCDESLKANFAPDPLTTVVLVRAFSKGDPLLLSGSATSHTPRAASDICLVKLNVGPGNPGPADAPSTSPGIGIEIWLPSPASWNGRLHALGGGGWAGGPAGSAREIADVRAAAVAGLEGAVSSTTDGGHPYEGDPPLPWGSGDFAMNPDGTINRPLWRDFSHRSLHEQAVKSKALARAYYGRPPGFSYWEGSSSGGRQGLALAQVHPGDFDGIIANLPSLYSTRAGTYRLYPQVVIQRDLAGVALSTAQQDLVSNAAIRACDLIGGQHLGYLLNPGACRYDPTRDPAVLCTAAGGQNATAACVSGAQAAAFNKFWYGLTSDGSAPRPDLDNGWDGRVGGKRRWYGVSRGTSLYNAYFSKMLGAQAGLLNVEGPYSAASDMVALELQDSTIAAGNFRNATANGANRWKQLSYARLAEAHDRGIALQSMFANINAANADLSAFKAHGGKLLTWHGFNDEIIPVQGTIHYYQDVVAKLGGIEAVQDFYRLYLVPGVGHASPNGTSNPLASPPVVGPAQFYALMVDWVEKGLVPGRVELHTPPGAPVRRSQPICPYPAAAEYVSGDPNVASSFQCAGTATSSRR